MRAATLEEEMRKRSGGKCRAHRLLLSAETTRVLEVIQREDTVSIKPQQD